MSDYCLTLRVQQGRLKAAMRKNGIKTAAELSRLSGVRQEHVGTLLNFKRSPRRKDGRWRQDALRICESLGEDPADIFPEHLGVEISTNKIEAFVDRKQLEGSLVAQLPEAGANIDMDEMKRVVEEALSELGEDQRHVVRARFYDDRTLDDIGAELGVTKEGVRQIQNKALRDLRSSRYLDILAEVCDFSTPQSGGWRE